MTLIRIQSLPLLVSLAIHAIFIIGTIHTAPQFSMAAEEVTKASSKATTITLVNSAMSASMHRPKVIVNTASEIPKKTAPMPKSEDSKKPLPISEEKVVHTTSPVTSEQEISQPTVASETSFDRETSSKGQPDALGSAQGSKDTHSSGSSSDSYASQGTTFNPKVIQNRSPRYPEFARIKRFQGTVIYRVKVLVNGYVGGAELVSSSGYRVLDQSAKEAIQYWRFQPATQFGRPIESWVEIPFTFELKS